MQTYVIARALVFNLKGEVLLLMRSDDDIYRPGEVDIPGGKVDEAEDHLTGVLRETEEETGLQLDRAGTHLLYAYTEVGFHSRLQAEVNYVCLGFVSRAPAEVSVTLSSEHKEFGWYSIEEALRLSAGIGHEELLKHLTQYGLFSDCWKGGDDEESSTK